MGRYQWDQWGQWDPFVSTIPFLSSGCYINPQGFFLFFFYPIILEIIHYGNPVTQPVPWNRFGGFEPISLGLMIGHSVYTLQKGLK